MRVAVVGGGVGGLAAAWYLQDRHEVVLFEASERIGGHANPVPVPHPTRGEVLVDTGFLVFNLVTYPRFLAWLEELGLSDHVRPTDMALSYVDEHRDLRWASPDLDGVFHQRRNLVRPAFWRMLAELFRFRRQARADLHAGRIGRRSMQEYLADGGYSEVFVHDLFVPATAAIWSVPAEDCLLFPAETYVRFFDNHLMLQGVPEKLWRTLAGSSATYLRAWREGFRGELRLGCPVRSVARDGVRVDGEAFDAVVLATHADTSLALLEDPSALERELLGAWRFAPNPAVLHTDARLMPPDRRLWRSWNLRIRPGATTVTYHLNRVQDLDGAPDVFLTLSPVEPIDPDLVLGRFDYTHPVFERGSLDAQARLSELQGQRSTWFCGGWCGFGFHEDAIVSALQAVEGIG